MYRKLPVNHRLKRGLVARGKPKSCYQHPHPCHTLRYPVAAFLWVRDLNLGGTAMNSVPDLDLDRAAVCCKIVTSSVL